MSFQIFDEEFETVAADHVAEIVLPFEHGGVLGEGVAEIGFGLAVVRAAEFGVGAADDDEHVVGGDLFGDVVLLDGGIPLAVFHEVFALFQDFAEASSFDAAGKVFDFHRRAGLPRNAAATCSVVIG